MTPQVAIWLASVLGAICFFVAGYAAAAGRAGLLARRVRGLEAELATEKERAARAAPPKVIVNMPPPEAGSRIPEAGSRKPAASTEHALNEVLARLGATKGMRAVALADDMGLLLAGVGDAQGSLAAYGALLRQIAGRAREYLPLGGFHRVEVEDEQHAIVSACPLSIHDAELALITLTTGSPPTDTQVSRVLRDAASVIG
jgi:hypothetical protein